MALTGYGSFHGRNIQHGLELAKKDLEKRGWKVELTYEDDGTIPQRSITAIRALSARGYSLFIGPTWSYQVEAAGPLYARTPVIAFSPATYSAVTGGPHAHLLHGTTPATAKVEPVSKWLKQSGYSKAAILYAACAWGETHREVYEQAAAQAGVKIVYNDHFDYGQEAASLPAMLAAIKSSGAEVVLSTSSAEAVGLIVKLMTELRSKAAFLSTDDLNDALAQKLVDLHRPGRPRLFLLALPMMEAFQSHYAAHYYGTAGIYSDTAYDGLMMFAQAIENGSKNAVEIESFLRKNGYQGLSGTFRFDKNGDTEKGSYVITELAPAAQ